MFDWLLFADEEAFWVRVLFMPGILPDAAVLVLFRISAKSEVDDVGVPDIVEIAGL
jgi:hypothetical protein